jgi:hypothetical protein
MVFPPFWTSAHWLIAHASTPLFRVEEVDLTLLVGFFHTTCAVLNAFEIPAPQASDPTKV